MLEYSTQKKLPRQIMSNYNELLYKHTTKEKWGYLDERKLWEEMVLCILSSNVFFETARSALSQLRYQGLLNEVSENPERELIKIIAKELHKPIYLPRRKDNSFRKYRFPNVRARNIVQAATVIYKEYNGLHSMLGQSKSEIEMRDFLANEIPGIGLKEASHFLRNIGYSDNLAIIDVHIISFLKEVSLIRTKKKVNINRQMYRKLELLMQEIAKSLNLNLAVLDMAIWKYLKYR